MSYFGKKFKKVNVESAADFLGKLNLSKQILELITNSDSLTSFTKNADGTLQYVVTDSAGKLLLDQNIFLGHHHTDFRAPDGMDTQVMFELEGDVLKSHIDLPDGKVVYMDRHFEANSMKLELYIKRTGDKATIYYDAV